MLYRLPCLTTDQALAFKALAAEVMVYGLHFIILLRVVCLLVAPHDQAGLMLVQAANAALSCVEALQLLSRQLRPYVALSRVRNSRQMPDARSLTPAPRCCCFCLTGSSADSLARHCSLSSTMHCHWLWALPFFLSLTCASVRLPAHMARSSLLSALLRAEAEWAEMRASLPSVQVFSCQSQTCLCLSMTPCCRYNGLAVSAPAISLAESLRHVRQRRARRAV